MGHWYFESSMDNFKSMPSGDDWRWKMEEGDAEWEDDSGDDSDTEDKLRVAQDMIDIFCESEDEDEHHGEDHDMMDGDMMDWDMMDHDKMDGEMDHDKMDGEMDHDKMDGEMDHDMDHHRVLMHHKKGGKKMSTKKTKNQWLCEEAHHIHDELDEYHHADQRGKEKKAHSWMKDLEGEWENIFDAATTIQVATVTIAVSLAAVLY